MKRIKAVTVIFLMCFGTSAFGQTEQLQNTSDENALLYYYIDPMVVQKGDTSATVTIEVTTTGTNISRVYIEEYPYYSGYFVEETNLVDDGTNGDRVAGDGVYTASNVPINTNNVNLNLGFGTHTTIGPDVNVEKTDGSSEWDFLLFGVIAEDQNFPAVELADGLFATQYAFFIEDPDGSVLDTEDWPLGDVRCGKEHFEASQLLYSVLPDSFDFIIVMPAHHIFDPDRNYAENTPYFVRAKNDIQNIGIVLFDNTSQFGSAGRLRGTIYHSWGYGSILDHEIGHSWCADLGESLNLTKCADCYGLHWNPLSDIGGQMAAFLFYSEGTGHLKDNGDGTWRIERDPDDNRLYSNLDLYAMGLIPSSEVQPVHLLVNPDLTDPMNVTAASVITYTIEDIMTAEGGERIPSYLDSPKKFNVAFIAVKNKPFTAEEYTYYSLVSKYFASQNQGELSLTTFYQATGGRGTLNPDLGVVSSVESATPAVSVSGFYLNQNYPNPFNHATRITFTLPSPSHTVLKVYDLMGRELNTLVEGYREAGSHEVNWDAENCSSGIYLCRLEAGSYVQTRKLILQK
ncbi:T9SS type A sorting domain-containing protein [bacterium]|nr:T9SS type A sorting domain-containing protein [bacterium]